MTATPTSLIGLGLFYQSAPSGLTQIRNEGFSRGRKPHECEVPLVIHAKESKSMPDGRTNVGQYNATIPADTIPVFRG